MTENKANLRASAANCIYQVVDKGRSLSDALPEAQQKFINPKDKALLQQLCYGVLRWLPRLDFFCSRLLQKPLKGKQRPFQFLLYVGCYQLLMTRIPPHAAISETVEAAVTMRAGGLKGLINGVLRSFQRQQQTLELAADKAESCRFGHPNWFIKQVKACYEHNWQQILEANQLQAPMWLRVNQRQGNAAEYIKQLQAVDIAGQLHQNLEHGICLDKATDVNRLPGFADGACSVQDGAAQFAAQLLDAQAGDKVLDACAAPGGKTCHIVERQPQLASIYALDCDDKRLTRVTENLTRLQLDAQLICDDASNLSSWWDGEPFDRILLDAPCSATGVIRRHPDIKWLRRAEDIEQLALLQRQILDAMWQALKPGGTLLYATCSVLPQENTNQMRAFLADCDDVIHVPINDDDTCEQPGWQLLPGEHNMDGFYYCRLQKRVE